MEQHQSFEFESIVLIAVVVAVLEQEANQQQDKEENEDDPDWDRDGTHMTDHLDRQVVLFFDEDVVGEGQGDILAVLGALEELLELVLG